MNLTKEEQEEAVKLLKHSPMLRHCSEEQLREVVKHMKKNVYGNGTILGKEGEPMQKMYILRRGQVRREKEMDGVVHHIDTQLSGYTVGSLHIMNKDPAYATSKCVGDVESFELTADDFNQIFIKNPQFAWSVAYSLSREVRRHTKLQRTPLLEQKSKPIPVVAVSIAASIESFYRAALNAFLNQKLTGKKMDRLFPNMHVQVPTRIMYINGFKGIRWYLDNHVKPEQYSNPTAVRLAAAITPGLCMTPISSILEACNAGHSNPKALYLRWMDGLVPRAGREVIFGVGLNQLSDWCEERVPYFKNPALVNAVGSLSAGLISGYMSHVVHNLSTLKLMDPSKTYKQHFTEYVKKSESRIPVTNLSPTARYAGSVAMACLFPAGCLIRICQIAGSFIILNGSINAMQRYGIKH